MQLVGGSTEPWIRDLAAGFAWRTDAGVYAIDFTEQLVTRGDISSIRVGFEIVGLRPLVLRLGTHRQGRSLGASLEWQHWRLDSAYVLHYALPGSYYASVIYIWDDALLATMGRALGRIGMLLGR